ncbi:MAG TPA: ATP-binding cassette domain-containing protein [Methylococcaceae bacterium]|nr:ATP-binding cassette domain-containing protein [Methylococcaceae bacterium]
MATAVSTDRLTKDFTTGFWRQHPHRGLDALTFEIPTGSVFGLLGPNGAGKSTLFALITRLYDSREGRVVINGYDVRRDSRQALAGLGVVFQQPTLDPDLSVAQNLHYHCDLHGLPGRIASQRIREELERQGMYERRWEKVRQLNGGHRRRVEIARALLHQPALLLLDEPTVGLDVPSRRAIVDYVHQLCAERRVAVLWASHLIDEIHAGDRLLILHRGCLLAQGGVAEILVETETADIGAAFQTLTGEAG